MQRLRVRYAKRGTARFTSHRDFSRAFERALRRAGIPMAYSSGFNPHPRISYANASATGAATEAEYLEIGLSEVCDLGLAAAALAAALPPGLCVLRVVPAAGAGLADRLEASHWVVRADVDEPVAKSAIDAFLAAEGVIVQRMTKNGVRDFDARGAVVSLTLEGGDLHLVLRHQTPLVRPDDVVTALKQVDERYRPAAAPLLTRLAQGPLVNGVVGDPFEDAPAG